MSLVEPADLNDQLRSARSWMKVSAAGNADNNDAVESLQTSEQNDPASQKKAQSPSGSLSAPLSQNPPPKVVAMPTGTASVAAGQYDRMIEDMIRTETQAEIVQHVIKVERVEVSSLVKQVARAKGRYLATLLESSKGKSVSSSRIEDLKQLRDTHEELLQGLNDLRRHILDGTVMVEGVRN